MRVAGRRGIGAWVVFTKGARGTYWCHVHRPDGAVVFVPGSDRKFRIPHDLAHVATERALGLTDGVFGSVMDGALFGGMRVVSGRRHHSSRRSDQVIRLNSASRALTVAELLAGAVHHAVETGHRARLLPQARENWAVVREDPFPYALAELTVAHDQLAALGARWDALPVDGTLDVPWTVG